VRASFFGFFDAKPQIGGTSPPLKTSRDGAAVTVLSDAA